jgi:hypothetical protein
MLDDLRNTATSGPEEPVPPELVPSGIPPARQESRPAFLGMTAAQRFVIVLMMFIMTCILGTFCLIITEKIVPPFF